MMEGEKYRPKAEDVQNDLDEVTGLLKDKIKIVSSTEIWDSRLVSLKIFLSSKRQHRANHGTR